MKLITMATALLLASITHAAPYTARRRQAWLEKTSRRAGGLVRSARPLAVNYTSIDDQIPLRPSKETQYDSNWAGAVQISSGITKVVGTANFPHISAPSSGNYTAEYGGSAWVGIDGDTCQSSILQTGIDWYIENGQQKYEAWYEWLPEYSYTFDIAVNPGDQIKMQVEAKSTTSGSATITNLSTGKNVSQSFSGETALCETNAEWIVEDFEVVGGDGQGSLIPFAKFGNVTFSNASYIHGNTTSGVNGSTLLDIQQGGEVLTKCGTTGSSTVQCSYAG